MRNNLNKYINLICDSMYQKIKIRVSITISLLFVISNVYGETFEFGINESVVGHISYAFSSLEQTLPDIARVHDLGYHEIKRANPGVDTWMPGERQLVIMPKKFVLPVVPHDGIVINIPEMRLYYFPKVNDAEVRQVITHPIGIGREGWSTPYVSTNIIQKKKDPYWYPPKSIREKYAEEGKILPKVVKPGPENPLGDFAMRLGLPAYLIHGTNRPYGVGMRVSSGCIRLYPEDIESLFSMVSLGTKVRIVNQPYKVGVLEDKIYLEANPFLEEDAEMFDGNLTSVVKMLLNFPEDIIYDIDWELAKIVINERKGFPFEIGKILTTSEEIVSDDTTVADEVVKSTLQLKLETGIHYRP